MIKVGPLWCTCSCSWLLIERSQVWMPLGVYALRQCLFVHNCLDPGVVPKCLWTSVWLLGYSWGNNTSQSVPKCLCGCSATAGVIILQCIRIYYSSCAINDHYYIIIIIITFIIIIIVVAVVGCRSLWVTVVKLTSSGHPGRPDYTQSLIIIKSWSGTTILKWL